MLLRNRVPARAIMASKNLLNKPLPFVPLPKPPSTSSRSHLSFTYRLIFSPFPSKRVSRIAPLAIRSSGLSYTSHARVPRSVPEVCLENPNVNSNNSLTFNALIGKLKNLGFDASSCRLGEETRLLCPRCKGRNSSEKSLSILITEDGGEARWNCFRGKCGWRGVTQAFGDAKSSYGMMNKTEVEEKWEITEESLELEPLSEQLVVWFSARMISRETLRRNRVMQRRRDNQIVIAFTYRRNGLLVNCKYRDVTKQFSQVKGAEKIFYGLDDIEGASEIIIVEGEMDKLSMEEAGFRNCVSVPDGAPPQVSSKGVPPEKSDKKYQYLWNCKKYLEKASRIILATDGDLPGQALAEELARRLGREKCWRIVWPKKNENEHFKDANEVLMIMGPNALREVIENAELYPIKGLFNFKDYFDEIDAYYHQTLGYELGVSTGWKALNDLYNCKGGVSSEMSLSILITVDGVEARWTCFRGKCGWRGMTLAFGDAKSSYGMMNKTELEEKREITEESLGLEPLSEQLVVWFSARMISRETLRRNRVMQRRRDNQVVIAFTYRRNGLLVNCKYRDITKRFSQVKGAEKIFYGLDDIEGASEIIIVEGEMDKLSMEEAGFRNCVSVPDGAPPQVSSKGVPPEKSDKKYQYLWNCKKYLEKASRIILATDGDLPGQALAEELARRLGREKCWRIVWPKKNENEHFKDANEVLMIMGPNALREVIENAELYPIKGLFNFKDYFDEIDAYYNQTLGYELGVSTGWKALNNLYNVVAGELTIVTGVPNSGKSEWIDALLCNLNGSVGWKFALCSMENKVREHARKLLEKHVKKPFFDVRYGESVERMSIEDFEEGKQWLSDTFYLIRCENESLPNIDWVLELAKSAVLRHGVNGLLIDPYNELDHQRPPNQTETEYVSQMLTKIKRFAQHHACHVWFVAHPRQLHHWVGGPPNLYDISGSAHFINKCDNGIVIHRNRDPDAGPLDQVQVCVRKVRNKVIGTIGDAYLSYDKVTGIYSDL